MEAIVGRMSIPSSPLDSQPPNSTLTLQRHAVGAERSFNLWASPWDNTNHHTPLFSDLLATNSCNTSKTAASHYDHHEPFESLQEMEAHTIGNLLPTDDDFLFGLVHGLENTLQTTADADADDMDVFKNVGGMDLGDDAPSPKTSPAPFAGEHPYGQSPSRTLFLTNINSHIKLEATRPGALRQSPVHSDMEQIENCQLLKQNKSGYPRGPASSSSVDSVCSFGTNTSWASFRPFMEKPAFHGISCSVPNGLPSLPRTESADIKPGLSEFSNSVGQFNSDFRGLQVPHSRAEYNNGVANGVPCYSDRDIPASGGFLPQGRVESTHLGSISSSSDMGNAFGTSVNGSGHVHGQHYMWSNSNYAQSPTFIWPSSSQLCSPQPQSRLRGISRTPSHASPLNIHHVGSAPAVSPYLRDKRYAEASGFHQGSFGSMRIPNSHFHPMDFFPPNMYPHVGGNFMDLPISSRDIGDAQQRGLFMYPSRGHMAKSFVSGEHARSRRNDSFSTPADNKKLYELDIDRISQGEDNRTTLMIKNIPNKYTSKMLMAAIDEHHRGTYDFIYLPIDFKNKCNVGYAFINMVDPSYIIRFYESFNGKKWENFNSEKVASLAYGRIQGKEALITHFQNSSLMNEDKRCRPILFHSDGPNAGDQVPFPMGVNIRSKSARSRSNSIGDTHQGTPPILPKEEYSSGDSSSTCTF